MHTTQELESPFKPDILKGKVALPTGGGFEISAQPWSLRRHNGPPQERLGRCRFRPRLTRHPRKIRQQILSSFFVDINCTWPINSSFSVLLNQLS